MRSDFQTPPVSSKLPQVGSTIFSVMTQLALDHQAINLSQGFPGFAPDAELLAAAGRALQNGPNQYAPMPGDPNLRQWIAQSYHQRYQAAYDPQTEITLTNGATEGLFAAITALIQPGDEVIVLEPCYDSYVPAIELSGGVPKFVELEHPNYCINWEAVKKSLSAKTRAILLNSPHNPTGMLLGEADLNELKRLVLGSNILVFSDEVYEAITFDGHPHRSLAADPELRPRTLVFGSFGKSLHVTGWKVGYCLAPEPLTRELRKVHQYVTFCAAAPLQAGIAAFLTQRPNYLEEVRALYQHKRDLFAGLMAQTPFQPLPNAGSYFQLYSYAGLSQEPDTEFVQTLIREAGVAAIPVSVFYHQPTDHQVIRFCFAKEDDTLHQAVGRLQAWAGQG